MKIGIFLDLWKKDIFHRHLSEAGFTYEETPGITPDTMAMIVYTDDKDGLEKVVREANHEAWTKEPLNGRSGH